MNRKWMVVIVGWVVLLMPAAALSAGGSKEVKLAGSLSLFGRDVPMTLGGFERAGIVGAAYEMTGPLGKGGDMGWAVRLGYGVGSQKQTSTIGGVATVDEASMTHWSVRVGFDCWTDCCGQSWFAGPGLTYMSTKVTEKSTGNPDFELEPYKAYGFEPRIGGSMKASGKTSVYGSMSMFLGRASWEQTIAGIGIKQSSWFVAPSWFGGVRLTY